MGFQVSFTPSGSSIPEGASRYWRLETQGDGSEGFGNGISELNMTFDDSSQSLTSFTVTSNNAANFAGGAPLSELSDGILDFDNTNFAFVDGNQPDMDFFVDFGAGNEKVVSVYSIAPQAISPNTVLNTVLEFNAYRSADATNWTLVKAFTSISTGFGPWSPEAFRDFDLTT